MVITFSKICCRWQVNCAEMSIYNFKDLCLESFSFHHDNPGWRQVDMHFCSLNRLQHKHVGITRLYLFVSSLLGNFWPFSIFRIFTFYESLVLLLLAWTATEKILVFIIICHKTQRLHQTSLLIWLYRLTKLIEQNLFCSQKQDRSLKP